MKNCFYVVVLLLLASFNPAFAQGPTLEKNTNAEVGGGSAFWPLLQPVLVPGIPPYTNWNVYGIRLGLPVSGGSGVVNGIDLSPVAACSEYVNGIQMSPFYNTTKVTNGFRCSSVNDSSEKVRGFNLGFVNLNSNDAYGWDLGFVNMTSNFFRGLQLGIVNYSGRNWFQIGLYNQSKSYGFQIGIINIIEDSYIPFFPGINLR